MTYAIFNFSDSGYDCDVEYARRRGLIKGQKYEMSNAVVGGYHSNIYLKEIEGRFNSVQFDFEDESGNAVDIYHNPAYSTYCCLESKHPKRSDRK